MGDVADILSMAGAVAAAGTVSGSQRKPNGGVKKPDGMSREVFALLGNASLPPCVQTAGFQNNKAELAAKKAVPWLWAEFSNSARSDGFKLKHWQRASNVLSDYAFARFNKRTAVVSYTDEEYAQVDVANDGWTKEDTDYLFELCAQYDLRWYVVQDRWERHREVTVTDIKNRYFSVSKKIITSRRAKKLVVASMSTPPVDAPTATVSAKAMAQTENAILDFNYDAEYDRKRTLQLARLYSRPASEEKEETNLLNEIRRTDMQLRRLQQDQPKVSLISKRKKSAHTPLQAFPPTLADTAFLSEANAAAVDVSKRKQGVYLRSGDFISVPSVLGIGTRMENKVYAVMQELGVPHRPVPTAKIVGAYDKLRQDIIKLLALQTKTFDSNCKLCALKGLPVPVRPGALKSKKRKPPLSGAASTSSQLKKQNTATTRPAPSSVAPHTHEPARAPSAITQPAPTYTGANPTSGGINAADVRTSGRKRQVTAIVADNIKLERANTKKK